MKIGSVFDRHSDTMLKLMSPVVVVISQIPPLVHFGTLTSPVVLDAVNILSESSVPVTLPVDIFTKISPASHFEKVASPVVRVIESFSVATVFSNRISPVVPVEIKDLHFTFERRVSPEVIFTIMSSEQRRFETWFPFLPAQ